MVNLGMANSNSRELQKHSSQASHDYNSAFVFSTDVKCMHAYNSGESKNIAIV